MSDDWLRYVRDPSSWSPPTPRPGPIHTDRYQVRLYERGDGPKLFEAIDRSRESILPWMIWATTDHRRVEDTIHFVERSRRGYARSDCEDFPMGIFDRASGRVVGGTGLHAIHSPTRQAEIGYWVRADEQRRGVCTEAVGALIGSALRSASLGGWGLRRIVVYVAVQNVASRKVCERLGLRLEAKFKAERYNGYPPESPLGYHDTFMFAVLADEWDHARQRAHANIAWTSFTP